MAGDKQAGLMLAWQLAGVVSILAWTGALCLFMFGVLKIFGKLRVDPELEKKGLDIPKHGEPAYPLESYGHGYLERIMTLLENGQLKEVEMGLTNNGFTNDSTHHEHPEMRRMHSDEYHRDYTGTTNGSGTKQLPPTSDNTRM